MRSPCTTMKSSTRLPQPEKACSPQQRTSTDKIKRINKILKYSGGTFSGRRNKTQQGRLLSDLNTWVKFTVVLEKTLENPLDCKKIHPVHPKGNPSWIFTGRIDAEAETPILRPLDVRNWLIGKDLDAGKDWRQEEKGKTVDEMVGWHHRLNGHEF